MRRACSISFLANVFELCIVQSFILARQRFTLESSISLNSQSTQSNLEKVVSTDWLEKHIYDEDIIIVDIRGSVEKRGTGENGKVKTNYIGHFDSYKDAHIGKAVFVDWTKDISEVDSNGVANQLLSRDDFITKMEERGIDNGKKVIVYDDGNSLFATRLWWAMRVYGHHNVHILDGKPLSNEVECPLKQLTEWNIPESEQNSKLRVTIDDVQEILKKRTQIQLVDARGRDQYFGIERRANRAGHIPSAINVPYKSLLKSVMIGNAEANVFKNLSEIREKETIAYCNGGVASTMIIFALYQLGNENVKNYDGSWNEWGNREETPIEIE